MLRWARLAKWNSPSVDSQPAYDRSGIAILRKAVTKHRTLRRSDRDHVADRTDLREGVYVERFACGAIDLDVAFSIDLRPQKRNFAVGHFCGYWQTRVSLPKSKLRDDAK